MAEGGGCQFTAPSSAADLPDGVVYLVAVEDADELDEERAALIQALDEADDDGAAGRVVGEDELRAVVRAAR